MAVSKSQANLLTAIGGAVIDYVEFTSNVSVNATAEGSANTVVTSNSVYYDGSTAVDIQFFATRADTDGGAAGRAIVVLLYEDSTLLGRMGTEQTPAASALVVPLRLSRKVTPSAGNHTYTVKAIVSAGTSTIKANTGGSGNDLPGYIKIVRESSLIGSTGMANVQGGFAPLNASLLIPATNMRATGCIVAGTSTALTSGQYNSLAFGSADIYDSDAFHDPSSQNTRLIVPTGLGGIYIFGYITTWPNTTNGNTEERMSYRITGGADVWLLNRERSTANMAVGTVSFASGSTMLSLAAGDYVEARQWVTNATSPQTTTSYQAWLFLFGRAA